MCDLLFFSDDGIWIWTWLRWNSSPSVEFFQNGFKKKCTAFYIGYIGSSMAIIAHSGENKNKKCDFLLALL